MEYLYCGAQRTCWPKLVCCRRTALLAALGGPTSLGPVYCPSLCVVDGLLSWLRLADLLAQLVLCRSTTWPLALSGHADPSCATTWLAQLCLMASSTVTHTPILIHLSAS